MAPQYQSCGTSGCCTGENFPAAVIPLVLRYFGGGYNEAPLSEKGENVTVANVMKNPQWRQILSSLLPDTGPFSRKPTIWILFLVLSPAACIGGIWVYARLAENSAVEFSLPRSQAVEISRRFAHTQGLNFSEGTVFVGAQANDDLHRYYRTLPPHVREMWRGIVPEMIIRVSQISPDGDESLETILSPQGRILGHVRRFRGNSLKVEATGSSSQGVGFSVTLDSEPAARPSADSEEDPDSLEIARQSFLEKAGDGDFLEFSGPELYSEGTEPDISRTYVWTGKNAASPELSASYQMIVRDNLLIAGFVKPSLDPDFVSTRLTTNSIAAVILKVIIAIVVVLISIYALILYVKRTRQREVSHRRSLALGVLAGMAFTMIALLSAVDLVGIETRRPGFDPMLLIALSAIVVVYLLIGLLLGLFWGSGEGEVREVLPGKLTSLDALVLGKILSWNVARSVIVGTAFGSWLLLFTTLAQLPWVHEPVSGLKLSNLAFITYTRLPWLFTLAAPVTSALPVSILGLLLPVAFSFRSFRSRRLRMLFLIVLAFLGCSWIGLQIQPFFAGMLYSLVTAGFLLLAFFSFDLLTAMIALSSSTLVGSLTNLNASTSFAGTTVVAAAVIALMIFLLQFYSLFRGRSYREEEVRPLYADHLAHRQALQAEVSAARQAQLRLIPREIPLIEGLTLAASCLPARVVGGDFYDFFPISSHQIGVFLAEGGGSGLPAALMIAFTKGLLMPLAPRDDSAQRVMSRLQASLGSLLAQNPQMGVLYAVIDGRRGVLEYARLGAYPQLIVNRPADVPDVAAEQTAQSQIIELLPGDAVAFFTDGIANTLSASGLESPHRWIGEFLNSHPEDSAEKIHQEFQREMKVRTRKARRSGVEDDLSTIILRFYESERQEEVA